MRGVNRAACVFLAAAIVCDILSKPLATAAVRVAAQGDLAQDGTLPLPPEAARLIRWSDALCGIGVALAGIGVILWLASFRQGHTEHSLLPIGLIALYAVLYLFVT